MTDSPVAQIAGRQARTLALVVPREHGAWGLLLIPLFTGVAAGLDSAQQIWPTVLFAVAALALFWLRTPVESLVGASPMSAHSREERRMALLASILLAAVSLVCLAATMWGGKNLKLLVIGASAAAALVLQAVLRTLGRNTRMAAQLVGAIGLSATAPAAYYMSSGDLGKRALILWVANWLFAGNQIHFVQLRIHAARAATFPERFARGRIFFFANAVAVLALGLASFFRLIPWLVPIAFVPVMVRGLLWFFRKPERLDIKGLGWSEMKQGVVFGILLAMAFRFS